MERLEHIKELFRQYLAKTISDRDRDELMQFFANGDETEINHVIGDLSADDNLHIQNMDRYDVRAGRILDQIRRTTSPAQQQAQIFTTRPTRSLFIRVLPYAAAILLFASIGWYMYDLKYSSRNTTFSTTENIIPPGSNRAMVTLSDGQVLVLSEEQEAFLSDGDALTYADGSTIRSLEEVQTLTLSTPRAGQYAVTLSDGTRVWLNAASEIVYPSRFDGDERTVTVKGEAFFEVAPNKDKPFIVQTARQTIRVLGTQFNIQAYDNETIHQTTLVEGAVSIGQANGLKEIELKPGQQAVSGKGSPLRIQTINAEEYTSWKDGIIVLNSYELPEILRQLERWYDVSFDGISDQLRTEKVFGMIERDVPLNDILKTLEADYNVQFKINERRIIMSIP